MVQGLIGLQEFPGFLQGVAEIAAVPADLSVAVSYGEPIRIAGRATKVIPAADAIRACVIAARLANRPSQIRVFVWDPLTCSGALLRHITERAKPSWPESERQLHYGLFYKRVRSFFQDFDRSMSELQAIQRHLIEENGSTLSVHFHHSIEVKEVLLRTNFLAGPDLMYVSAPCLDNCGLLAGAETLAFREMGARLDTLATCQAFDTACWDTLRYQVWHEFRDELDRHFGFEILAKD